MSKKSMRQKLTETALAKIMLCQQRIGALGFAVQDIARKDKLTGTAETQYGELLSLLYKDLSWAYRDLFMWGALGIEKAREEAARICARKFLIDQQEVRRLYNLDEYNYEPYSSETDDEVRGLIKAMCDEILGEGHDY